MCPTVEVIHSHTDKARDDESQEILKALENIDDDCADYEVHLVAMVDNLMAKKYGIRDPPGLAYFRHGKHIKFTGTFPQDRSGPAMENVSTATGRWFSSFRPRKPEAASIAVVVLCHAKARDPCVPTGE